MIAIENVVIVVLYVQFFFVSNVYVKFAVAIYKLYLMYKLSKLRWFLWIERKR